MNIEEQIKEKRYFEAPNVPIEQVSATVKDGTNYVLQEVNIQNLLKQQREEAVRGFQEWLIDCDALINFENRDYAKQYLSSKDRQLPIEYLAGQDRSYGDE